jgi:hypothetical protein
MRILRCVIYIYIYIYAFAPDHRVSWIDRIDVNIDDKEDDKENENDEDIYKDMRRRMNMRRIASSSNNTNVAGLECRVCVCVFESHSLSRSDKYRIQ